MRLDELGQGVQDLYKYSHILARSNTLVPFFDTLLQTVIPEEDKETRQYIAENVLTKFSSASYLSRTCDLTERTKQLGEGSIDKTARYHELMGMGDFCFFSLGILRRYAEKQRKIWKLISYGIRSYDSAAKLASTMPEEKERDILFTGISRNFEGLAKRLTVLADNFMPLSRNLHIEILLEEAVKFKETGKLKMFQSAEHRNLHLRIPVSEFSSLFRQ